MTERSYGMRDALESYLRQAFAAQAQGHWRKAEALRRRAQWLRDGCVGRKPSLRRWGLR